MPGQRGEEWARRVVLAKLVLTLLVALAGSLVVYFGRSQPAWIQLVGLLIVALSPLVSYLIVTRAMGE